MKPVHAPSILLSCLATLGILIGPSLHAEVPAGQTQRLKSPDQTPEGLSPSDWAGIRTAYEAGRTEVEASGAPTSLTTNPIAQQAYLKASNSRTYDQFGYSVAVSGDTVVVGAAYKFTYPTGDIFEDNPTPFAGAAYVFVRSGTTWTQQAYLEASNAGADDLFGGSVAVFGDTMVVGATGEASSATGINGNQADNSARSAGAAYVFVRSGTTWTQQAYLKASNTGVGNFFGSSVAMSGDTLIVGASGADAGAGAAYVFVRSGTTWTQQAHLKASNPGRFGYFGHSVAVSGDTAVVGAFGESSNATGVNGNQADNSAPNAGAAYVFVRSGTTWMQQAYLKASNTGSNDSFGDAVAVSGDTVVVGARAESSNATGVNGSQTDDSARWSGAAYIFVRSGMTWTQQAYLKASNPGVENYFGYSVAMSGDILIVGAYNESSNATGVNGNQADNSARYAGAAYAFVRIGASWTQQAYLKASNTGQGDWFGWEVAVSGDTVVVGAPNEDAGAAYVFTGFGPAVAPTIASSGNDFLLSFPGEPGLSYRVQYTTSPDVPQVWNEFTPPAIYTATPDGAVTHRDVNPTAPQRLYRAVASP